MPQILKDSLHLLREIVAIPSVTFHEQQVCQHISNRLTEWGVAHHRVENNLLALAPHYRPGRPTLMLCAHIDTVPPCEGYTFDPYTPFPEQARRALHLDEPFIAGLGSNDDGGSVVASIAVLRRLADRDDLPVNLLIALCCEEERGGDRGVSHLWEHFFGSPKAEAAGIPTPDLVIIAEPTGGMVCTSERGLLVIDAAAHGKSGHAARNEGVNALYIALDDIGRIRRFRFDRHSPLMGNVHVNITQINAGIAHNVVPDLCTFVVDIRPTERYSNVEILQLLQRECRSTLTARNLRHRSNATQLDSPLLRAVHDLGLPTASSPTGSDWMRTPVDAIKFGPGESERSHRSNEFILVREITTIIDQYIQLIERLRF